jgi:hypothetical protein
MERYFWGITILIVLLSAISGYDTPINLQNIIELALWCTSVPIFFAFFFHLTQAENKIRYRKHFYCIFHIFIVYIVYDCIFSLEGRAT